MFFNRPHRSRKSRRPVVSFAMPARLNAARLRLEALDERIVPAFLDAVSFAAGTGPDAVASGDFNGDDVLDLAVVGGSMVSVLLGNADGTFQPAIGSAAGNTPDSLAVGDFNDDGKLDIATADGDGNYGYNTSLVTALLGRGDGTFQAPTAYDLGSWQDYYGAESVAVGDFNADGKLDIGAVSNTYQFGYNGVAGDYHGFVHVLLGNGSGTFSNRQTSWLGGGFHTTSAVGDFNGDNRLDFASPSLEWGTLNVVLGSGNGGFGDPTTYRINRFDGMYDNAPVSIVAADLNNDGRIDLAVTEPFTDSVAVLLGNGLGAFSTPQGYAASPWAGALSAADFNGDGALDLITARRNGYYAEYDGTVTVSLGTGTGAFAPPLTYAVGRYPSDTAVGDFNGDGRVDAVSANTMGNNVSVLLNDGVWPSGNAPSISISDAAVTEGNSGTVNATFTVSLSAVSDLPVTVNYATSDDFDYYVYIATVGVDYQATSGTLTFTPGETTKTVTVPIYGDRLPEGDEYYGDESFLLVLTEPTYAFPGEMQGVGAIVDDEPRLSIDYGPVSVIEGNIGTTTTVFTVRLGNAYDQPVDVNFSTAEGDTQWWETGGYYGYPPDQAATVNIDYQAKTGTLTFAPGETEKTIEIAFNGDRTVEGDEYFSVDLTGTSLNATIDGWADHAVGAILDDEPHVTLDSASATEGHAGTTAMTFTVALSAASDAPVTVDYATFDYGWYWETAKAGIDYQATSGTLTFAPGQTTQNFTVLVHGDRLGEYDETFAINIGSTDAHIDSYYHIGTILDDEPRISVNSASITEGNRGTKVMTFTVTLSLAYDQTVTVNYHTQDESAKAGEDYVATSGTLTFLPGETSKTFTVVIKGDRTKESDEYFTVWLTDASSNSHLWHNYDYGYILNDDGGGKGGKGKRA